MNGLFCCLLSLLFCATVYGETNLTCKCDLDFKPPSKLNENLNLMYGNKFPNGVTNVPCAHGSTTCQVKGDGFGFCASEVMTATKVLYYFGCLQTTAPVFFNMTMFVGEIAKVNFTEHNEAAAKDYGYEFTLCQKDMCNGSQRIAFVSITTAILSLMAYCITH